MALLGKQLSSNSAVRRIDGSCLPVYSCRSKWPTTPQKARPVVMPIDSFLNKHKKVHEIKTKVKWTFKSVFWIFSIVASQKKRTSIGWLTYSIAPAKREWELMRVDKREFAWELSHLMSNECTYVISKWVWSISIILWPAMTALAGSSSCLSPGRPNITTNVHPFRNNYIKTRFNRGISTSNIKGKSTKNLQSVLTWSWGKSNLRTLKIWNFPNFNFL